MKIAHLTLKILVFFSPPRPVSGMLKMIVKSKFDGKINIFIVLYISTLSKLNTSNQK